LLQFLVAVPQHWQVRRIDIGITPIARSLGSKGNRAGGHVLENALGVPASGSAVTDLALNDLAEVRALWCTPLDHTAYCKRSRLLSVAGYRNVMRAGCSRRRQGSIALPWLERAFVALAQRNRKAAMQSLREMHIAYWKRNRLLSIAGYRNVARTGCVRGRSSNAAWLP
jgi:hypothetical protein